MTKDNLTPTEALCVCVVFFFFRETRSIVFNTAGDAHGTLCGEQGLFPFSCVGVTFHSWDKTSEKTTQGRRVFSSWCARCIAEGQRQGRNRVESQVGGRWLPPCSRAARKQGWGGRGKRGGVGRE